MAGLVARWFAATLLIIGGLIVIVNVWPRATAPDPQPAIDLVERETPSPTDLAPGRTPGAAKREAPLTGDSEPPAPTLSTNTEPLLVDLRGRNLIVPVAGVETRELQPSFHDRRDGTRAHEALDIVAPRHTPVLAVESGRIAKLFTSKAGGLTIYQFDPSSTYAYYYAHLQQYADGLRDGAAVTKGQRLGTVGTSGNAPPNTPHLHFAIFKLTPEKQWWKGVPLDPYEVWRR
jgi:peptidoglycan LD-endopeptidase LytH